MIRPLILATLTAAAVGSGALAAPVTLRADIRDDDGLVTLGEIFDVSGPGASTPVATRAGASVALNAVAVQAAARRAGYAWANAEGLRQIIVRSAAPTAAQTRGNVDVLTWARSIASGEIIQPEDLVWGKAALAPADAPNDPDAVIGLSARRPLRVGAAVAGRDVAAPLVIKPGEIITLTFEDAGITLALQAKAMTGGAVGETIAAQNPASKKIVQAVAIGPGQAVVGPAADRARIMRNPVRYAAR